MPYTTVTAGSTITASWANANVRDQVVTPFATASARTSAITAPVEGMVTYLADSNSMWMYNGSAWVPPNALYIRKTLDETVTSSTTLQDDNALVLAVAANSVYEVDGMVIYTDGGGTGRIKLGWTAPTSATLDWINDGLIDTETTNSASTVWRVANTVSDSRANGSAASLNVAVRLYGLLVVSSTAGNLQLQWAQNASDATATTVRAGSFLIARQVA